MAYKKCDETDKTILWTQPILTKVVILIKTIRVQNFLSTKALIKPVKLFLKVVQAFKVCNVN